MKPIIDFRSLSVDYVKIILNPLTLKIHGTTLLHLAHTGLGTFVRQIGVGIALMMIKFAAA
jgi:hypothetical protein